MPVVNRMRARRRRHITTVAAVVVIATLPVPSSAQTSDEVAEQIAQLQVRADQTAEEWRRAESRAEELAAELATAEQQLAVAAADFDAMTASMTELAVRRYVHGSESAPIVFFTVDPMEPIARDVLERVATQQGLLDVDEYADLARDLADRRDEVEQLEADAEHVEADLERLSADLDDQLVDLEELRVELENEEIKRAYEAKVAALRKEREEAEARAAAEVAAREEAEHQRIAQAQAEQQAATVATAPARGAGVQTGATTPDPPSEPAPVVPSPAPVVGSPGWTCPVAGPTAFGDTWGDPRSGGRRHEGVDMMSPAGTPLVAVVAGSVTMKTNRLGGNVVWLNGVDGTRYYYAHLSAWEGSSRGVAAGDVIGYVGSTGNTSANHLHFEIHPNGGAAINPFSTVRNFC